MWICPSDPAAGQFHWVSRVPTTLQAAADLLKEIKAADLKVLEAEGYSSTCYTYEYGGVAQHWVAYHSQSAANTEAVALKRKLDNEQEQAEKALKNWDGSAFIASRMPSKLPSNGSNSGNGTP